MITIKNIKSKVNTSKKGFNTDIYLNDLGNIEINEAREIKDNSILFEISDKNVKFDNHGNIVANYITFLSISENKDGSIYGTKINNSITAYQGNRQESYSAQLLTNTGLLWLLNKLELDNKIYTDLVDKILISEKINISYNDILEVAEIINNDISILELEDYNQEIKIIIKNEKLNSIKRKIITTDEANKKDNSLESSLLGEDNQEGISNSQVDKSTFFDSSL